MDKQSPTTSTDTIETCFSCGITDPRVEAIGIWHCPNALCGGCGAQWFRYTLDSYEDLGDGTHEVDEEELLLKGTAYMKKQRFLLNGSYMGEYIKPDKEDDDNTD
jgi:hypothetical protein